MTAREATTVTLRALAGRAPLDDERIRGLVIAAAHAIAERHGVRVIAIETEPTALIATLATGRLPAIGFAAELRRTTNAWHEGKFGETLWGESPDVTDGGWRKE